MTQEWRTIPDLPDYEVSNQGNVRRLTAGQGAVAGKQLRLSIKKWGGRGYRYLRLRVKKNNDRLFYVHRLVAFAFIGPQPSPKHEIAHANGKCDDNRLENLRWVTRKQNEADKIAHGKANRGERHGMSRLTEAAIKHIRQTGTTPALRKVLAAQYQTTERNVRHIRARTSWRHLSEE